MSRVIPVLPTPAFMARNEGPYPLQADHSKEGILNQRRQEIQPYSDFILHSNTYRVVVAKSEKKKTRRRFRGM